MPKIKAIWGWEEIHHCHNKGKKPRSARRRWIEETSTVCKDTVLHHRRSWRECVWRNCTLHYSSKKTSRVTCLHLHSVIQKLYKPETADRLDILGGSIKTQLACFLLQVFYIPQAVLTCLAWHLAKLSEVSLHSGYPGRHQIAATRAGLAVTRDAETFAKEQWEMKGF